MKENIFNEARHCRVQRDRTNITTNGREQAVDMVLQKLDLNKLLSYLRVRQTVFTKQANGASSLNFNYFIIFQIKWLLTFWFDGYTTKLAKLEMAGMVTNLTGPIRNFSEIIDIYHIHRLNQSKLNQSKSNQ